MFKRVKALAHNYKFKKLVKEGKAKLVHTNMVEYQGLLFKYNMFKPCRCTVKVDMR